jgi:AbiV family abortive infection protein
VYLDACHAAYLNAIALKDDATLLCRHRRYARAAALAVTGLEEGGKALILWLLGLGRVRESHRGRLLEAVRTRHHVKQATALPLRLTGKLIPVAKRIKVRLPTRNARPRN